MSRRRAIGCVGCGCLVLLCAGGSCGGVAAIPVGARALAVVREVDDARQVAPGSFVDVDGEQIHVQRWGEGGPRGPLVLVPGTSAWAGTWVEIAEPLASQGYDVVALDLPPFGYSDRGGGLTRGDQARRINGVIAALGLERPALLGHSFGGGATFEAALRTPGLRRLFLLDVAIGLGQGPTPGAPVLGNPVVAEPLVALTMSNPAFIPTGVGVMVHDPATVTVERVDRYRRPLTVRGTTSEIAAWVPELLAPSPSRAADPQEWSGFSVPTTLIWGAEDTATPVAQAEALQALLPHGTLVILPGVGHLPQIEDPAAVVRAILENDPVTPLDVP